MMDPRYLVRDPSELLSPSLLIYPKLVRQNLETMIAMAHGPERLRPHVKTHKMAEIVRLAESMGIHKHKCATIAEAEMVAAVGGADVLLVVSARRAECEAVRQACACLPEYGVSGDRRSPRLGAGAFSRRGGARAAHTGVNRSRDRNGAHRNRAGRRGRRTLRPRSTACRISSPTACTPMTARSMTMTWPCAGRPRNRAWRARSLSASVC